MEVLILLGLMAFAAYKRAPPTGNAVGGVGAVPSGGTSGGPSPTGPVGGGDPGSFGVMPPGSGPSDVVPQNQPGSPFYPDSKPAPSPRGSAPSWGGIHVQTVIRDGRRIVELVNGNQVLKVYSNTPVVPKSGTSTTTKPRTKPPRLKSV